MFLNSPGNGLFFLVKIKKETIAEIAEAIVPQHDAYLVDVQVRGESGETVVQVFVDTDGGISIGHCSRISKAIASRIEELEVEDASYKLEVSSPGLDKPLKLLRQYQTNVGREVHIVSGTGETERADDGVIKAVEGSAVRLELKDGSTTTIEFESIQDCRHRLPW